MADGARSSLLFFIIIIIIIIIVVRHLSSASSVGIGAQIAIKSNLHDRQLHWRTLLKLLKL
jgi:hypothetical protein